VTGPASITSRSKTPELNILARTERRVWAGWPGRVAVIRTGLQGGRQSGQGIGLQLLDVELECSTRGLRAKHQDRERGGPCPQAVDHLADGGDRHQGLRRQEQLLRSVGCDDLDPRLAVKSLDLAMRFAFGAIQDLDRAIAKGIAAPRLFATEVGGKAELQRGSQGELGRDLALQAPSGAIEGDVLGGHPDTRCIGRNAETQ
jgi:hypothetical protein